MQEVEAMEFFDRVVDDDPDEDDEPAETITLEHESGAALEVEVLDLDRNEMLDELNEMPDKMLELLASADDAEEADEEARQRGMLASVDGDTARAFESICVKGLYHPQYTEDNLELIIKEFDFPVLFGIGAKVMEVSLEDTGSVTDFHEAGSDESSS